MATTETLDIFDDEPNIFVEKDWIKAGKKYSLNLPAVVQEAKYAVLTTPKAFLEKAAIPSPETPISKFVQHTLPHVSSEIIITKPGKWFSHHKPIINLDLLLTRSVPKTDFVAKLEESVGQEWLDGARSVVDPRFNDGADYLPLWIISFWRYVICVGEFQMLWRKARIWLENEKGKGGSSASVQQACHLLETSLPWGVKMPHCRNSLNAWTLTHFLGTLWLNDEHISMMVEKLVKDINEKTLDVCLADILFSIEIRSINIKLALPPLAKRKTLLGKLEKTSMTIASSNFTFHCM